MTWRAVEGSPDGHVTIVLTHVPPFHSDEEQNQGKKRNWVEGFCVNKQHASFLFLFLFNLTPLFFLPLGITLGWSACQIIEISLMCFSVSYHLRSRGVEVGGRKSTVCVGVLNVRGSAHWTGGFSLALYTFALRNSADIRNSLWCTINSCGLFLVKSRLWYSQNIMTTLL